MVGHVIDEESSGGALAYQTSVTIDERHDDRVDDALVDESRQFVA